MKKLSLISVFPEEDGMFFHNKVFRCLHSMMRERSLKICLGISKTRDTLYMYAEESILDHFIALPDIQTMLKRNIYEKKLEESTQFEPLLARVNNFDPKTKAKKKLSHMTETFGEIDKRVTQGKETYVDYVQYYREKLAKQQQRSTRNVYFIANKNNKKISIFASCFIGNPREMQPNTYGFVNRVYIDGD
jgi:hypothetical protein